MIKKVGKHWFYRPFSDMTYDRQILQILSEVGEGGISVQLLAKHLYNQNSTFFFSPDLEDLRSYVQQFLLKNSKSSQSLVESTGRRGYYRLNTSNNADARQLLLDFRAPSMTEGEKEEKPDVDLSLNLFDFD